MPEGFVLEKALDDIAAGTKWLAENTSMKKLVFVGNSGGCFPGKGGGRSFLERS